MKLVCCLLVAHCFLPAKSFSQQKFTRQDTLMGANTPGRSWWDAQRYDITVTPDYATKTIQGKTTITYTVIADQHWDYIQIDLQKPMQLDSIFYNNKLYINYPARP